jgi:hypothetical protein
VSVALDDLPASAPPVIAWRASRLLPYAAAAGIALVAVALVPLLRPAPGFVAPTTARVAALPGIQSATLAPARVQSLVEDRVGAPGQLSLSPRRLTSYLVYHGEYSGMLSAKLTDSHIVNNRAYAVAAQTTNQPAVR